MVDALDSKSNAAMCVGSSPTSGTSFITSTKTLIKIETLLKKCNSIYRDLASIHHTDKMDNDKQKSMWGDLHEYEKRKILIIL